MENISLNDVLNSIIDKENKVEVSLMIFNIKTKCTHFSNLKKIVKFIEYEYNISPRQFISV